MSEKLKAEIFHVFTGILNLHQVDNTIPVTIEEIPETKKHSLLQNQHSVADSSSTTTSTKLSKSQKIFKAAEELKNTEDTFLTIITMLDVDFKKFITEKNNIIEIVPQAKFNEIFSNMTMIRHLSNILYKDFCDCIEKWSEPNDCKIAHVLVKKGDFLKIFADYSKDYYKNIPLFQELLNDNPKFKEAVFEFQKRDCCQNLPISGFFLKPVQRIPQYQMLMKEYLKQISKVDNIHPDKADAEAALDIVTKAAVHVNEHIRKNDKFQELLELKERLGDPENLIKGGRYLLHHDKIKRRARKQEKWRYLILFNDALIVAKIAGQDYDLPLGVNQGLFISDQLELEHISVEESRHAQELPNDFIVNGKQKSYIFVGKNVEGKEEWLKLLEDAIRDRKTAIGTFKNENPGMARI